MSVTMDQSVASPLNSLQCRLTMLLLIQSNSIIVESIIVENSIIVDNLPSTEAFYLIKIQNSRNSKIVEDFFGKVV